MPTTPIVTRPGQFCPAQIRYIAEVLKPEDTPEREVTRALANARVRMNPHQIDAALFALQSPLSKGVLLADEVGLGKTIEAGLVLAQHWAERRRKILIIVPATLRKQWQVELREKFGLPSLVLDADAAKKLGQGNAFDQSKQIVLCSYEFASRREESLRAVPWHLVVFDEAHRLRNVYKRAEGVSKIAKTLRDATAHADRRILMSATPLQNSLMELYGLVSVIDPNFFGDDEGFRLQYIDARGDDLAMADLKDRLQPIVRRTLRRQVQKQGAIKFTKRFSFTQDFSLQRDEHTLYKELSAFLESEAVYALNERARHLQTLVLRKILASSSFAVAQTLDKMAARLDATRAEDLEGPLDDYEAIGDLADAANVSIDDAGVLQLETERERLAQLQALAASITSNAKADALLAALDKAFEMGDQLGAPRKAVIFTESRRTQQYLADFLAEHGFGGKIALLSGDNKDASTSAIYKAWKAKHAGTSRVSGSRSADTKAAIVEYFRDYAELLIATESGGEGINLQFCSLLFNYDLPWNPQRVEQRIGRVHRYGQKHDVVVVNFLNKDNVADGRVLELLGEKLNLFEGVFGASDAVLGAIESGYDIEAKISEIYAQCRTAEAINAAFDQLQLEFKDRIDAAERSTRQKVLDEFDAQVLQRLADRSGIITPLLDEHLRFKNHLAAALLPDYSATEHGFTHAGQQYVLSSEHEGDQAELFDLGHGLGKSLLRDAAQALSPAEASANVTLSFSSSPLQFSDLIGLIGASGYINVDKATITSGQSAAVLLASGVTDGGAALDASQCRRLLELHCASHAPNAIELPDTAEQARQRALEAELSATRRRATEFFDQENQRIERWAKDQRAAHDARLAAMEAELTEARNQLRRVVSLEDKIATKRRITKLERARDDAMDAFFQERKRIQEQEDAMIDRVEDALQVRCEVEQLFCLRWSLQP